MTNKYEYDECTDKGNNLYFSDGILSCSTYNYEIDSFGYMELNDDETYKLYLIMKEYYENKKGTFV